VTKIFHPRRFLTGTPSKIARSGPEPPESPGFLKFFLMFANEKIDKSL
jgi:hypothetical protein